MVGTVKEFDKQRGFGFIEEESGRSIFVHWSDIETEERFKTLIPGAPVAYDEGRNERGRKAINVRMF